ncbi:MAG: alpha/beta hydrolase [Pseudomonadota bacterium]
MTRSFREITFTAPLTEPMATDAYYAPDNGAWRLVVIPGTPCNKMLYTRFLRTAPPGVEVVVISRPGFGKGHEKSVTSFDEQVAAIRPFLETGKGWPKKNVVVMGVSYGGELALKAALDFPDAVAGVVTVAALIDEPHDYALTLEAVGRDPRVIDYVPNRWRKVREEIEARRAQIGPLMARFKEIEQPVEVVHGDFDALVPKSNADTLMAALGESARLEIIPGGTHYLELQYPRRLHAAVSRVMERAAPPAWRQPSQAPQEGFSVGRSPSI